MVTKILGSKQEVAEELKMSIHTLGQLLVKYPFHHAAGVNPKIMGRWRISMTDAYNWFRYVQRQESRHPEARRLRPEEPPELAEIVGR